MTFNVGLGTLRRTSCDPAELTGAVILEGAHPHHPHCPRMAQNQALSSQCGGPLAYILGCPVNLAFSSKFRNWFLVNTSSFHRTLIKAPHSFTYSQHFWVKTLILALYVSPPLEWQPSHH